MRLAYFSPVNPQKSGISDYSEELLPALARGAEIHLYVDGFVPANKEITSSFEVYDYRKQPALLDTLSQYDAVLCQMGNSHRYHRGIYSVTTLQRTIIVFHDFAFQHFFLERARALQDPATYLDELEVSAGLHARQEAEEALSRGAAPPHYQNPLGFPMNLRLANQAEGIIVHSEWSRSRLSGIAPGVPIAKINLHVKVTTNEQPRPQPWPRESLSIGSFGFVTASKGLESALRALAVLKGDFSFHYWLVGEPDPYFDVGELISLYELEDRVSISSYVSFEEFNRRISETDIAINLRDQTVGETSSSLCRLMAAGVPALVSNIGWFSELPDDCVVKIDPGPNADLLIAVYLKELIEDAGLRTRIGSNAQRLMRQHHQVEQSADNYLEFIRSVIDRRAQRTFFDGVCSNLAELSDGEPDELLLASAAPAMSELVSS